MSKFPIEGMQTTLIEVEASVGQIITGLKSGLNLIHEGSGYFLCEIDNGLDMDHGLYWKYDTSYHGSPNYEYQLITKDPNIIKAYKLIIELEETLEKIEKSK
jgi:hypothetical protein